MNIQDAQTLIDFNYWARDRMLDAVNAVTTEQFTRSLGNSFGSIRDTLVHTMWAEMIWFSRWRGETTPPTFAPEAHPDAAAVRKAWSDHEVSLRDFFKTVDEQRLNAKIAYKNLNGLPYETPLWQMLQHVVNHGTYHRGQVTTMLRQLGAAPPKATDLIFYFREKEAEQR